MNIVLDTNIIIPFEDTGKELLSAYASLKRLGTKQKHCFFVHPSQIHDLKRDADVQRRSIMLSRLEQYSKIDSPSILSKSECAEIGWQSKNVNDEIDNAILFTLYRGAVHLGYIRIGKIHQFKQPITLNDLNNSNHAPQSYVYVKESMESVFEKLKTNLNISLINEAPNLCNPLKK